MRNFLTGRNTTPVLLFVSLLFLSGCVPSGSGAESGQSPITGLLPFVLLFVLFYFLIIRPQRNRSRLHEEMLKSLKRGDKILTNGGIYATITEIGEGDGITLEIAKGVKVKASRSAVASKAEGDSGEKAGS